MGLFILDFRKIDLLSASSSPAVGKTPPPPSQDYLHTYREPDVPTDRAKLFETTEYFSQILQLEPSFGMVRIRVLQIPSGASLYLEDKDKYSSLDSTEDS